MHCGIKETASMDSNAIVSVPQVSLNEILTPSGSQPTESPLSLSKATIPRPRRKIEREDNIGVEQRLLDIEAKKLELLQHRKMRILSF